MNHSWKVGDRLVVLPPDMRDGFREAELIERVKEEDISHGTVTDTLEDYPEPGQIRLEVTWDDDYEDSRESPEFVVGATWDFAYED